MVPKLGDSCLKGWIAWRLPRLCGSSLMPGISVVRLVRALLLALVLTGIVGKGVSKLLWDRFGVFQLDVVLVVSDSGSFVCGGEDVLVSCTAIVEAVCAMTADLRRAIIV